MYLVNFIDPKGQLHSSEVPAMALELILKYLQARGLQYVVYFVVKQEKIMKGNDKVFELENSLAGYEIYQSSKLVYQVYIFDKAIKPYAGCWIGEFIMLEHDALAGFRIPQDAIKAGNDFIVSIHNALTTEV